MAPAPSKIDQLPSDTISRIKGWLGERNRSVDDFVAFLNDEIGLDIARSSAHRYQQKEEKQRRRLRQSREMTQALAQELGDAAVQGKHGRLLVETARTHVHDFMAKLDEEGSEGLNAKDIANLGKGLAELSRALRLDQDFEAKIREQTLKDAAERAVEIALKIAAEKGITLGREALAEIRQTVGMIRE